MSAGRCGGCGVQGMELYPRVGRYFDIKTFTNCRFGMMSWPLLALTYAIKQVPTLHTSSSCLTSIACGRIRYKVLWLSLPYQN